MIVIDFYFTDSGGWIKYEENGFIINKTFDTSQSLHDFIQMNNLPLTYKGCVNCN